MLIASGSALALVTSSARKLYKLYQQDSIKGTLVAVRLPKHAKINIYDYVEGEKQ